MFEFELPEPHPIRGIWAPINYYPLLGSDNCFTVAVIAISDKGEKCVAEANGVNAIKCFYPKDADLHINFLRMAFDAVRNNIDKIDNVSCEGIVLGSSLSIGSSNKGSGHSIKEIAESWLEKVSILHHASAFQSQNAIEAYASVPSELADDALVSYSKEPRLITSLRSEVRSMKSELAPNFDQQFKARDRVLPVRLGYNGNNLVADFDRVSSRNIKPTLERIRSKLWVLAEHRDQTRHEAPKAHEMFVVPSERLRFSPEQEEIRIFNSACSDIEQEADRRDIRFRRFETDHQAAQHIFSMETSGKPLMLS